MMTCECGCEEFIGHQQVYVDVIVDGNNQWQRNTDKDMDKSVYESETPYGPYTCTNCGKEYDELKQT